MNTLEALKLFDLDSLENLNSKSLKSKYHKLAKIKHPDKNSGSHKEFVALKEAYLLLNKELTNYTSSAQENELSEIENLSKEEIIDKYKQTSTSLVAYQNAMANQIFSLDLTSQSVTETIEKYKNKKTDLKSSFEQDLSKLEKEIYPNFLRRALFFVWPTISEAEFSDKFTNLKKAYIQKEKELSSSFYEDLIINLTSGINQISTTIQKLDVN
jgi:curved DNA-binding protein CbpA